MLDWIQALDLQTKSSHDGSTPEVTESQNCTQNILPPDIHTNSLLKRLTKTSKLSKTLPYKQNELT